MTNVENSASARLSGTGVWLERGERFARAGAGVVGGIFQWLRRSLASLERGRARRAALRELHRLDDRLLKDIGLRRDQVGELVDGMFRHADVEAVTRPSREVAATGAEVISEANVGNERQFRSAA